MKNEVNRCGESKGISWTHQHNLTELYLHHGRSFVRVVAAAVAVGLLALRSVSVGRNLVRIGPAVKEN